MMQQNTQENFSREKPAVMGSDRSFGLVMAAALGLLALLNWWHAGRVWPWLGTAAVLFIACALLYAPVLRPLNKLWFKLGLLLHAVMNPVIMGLLFFGTIWPTGAVMRAMGKDMLRLRREPASDSYWIVRRPPGPAPESMKDQF
jgi:hypothetical protein